MELGFPAGRQSEIAAGHLAPPQLRCHDQPVAPAHRKESKLPVLVWPLQQILSYGRQGKTWTPPANPHQTVTAQVMATPRAQSAGAMQSQAWTVAACVTAFVLTITALWANMTPGGPTVRSLMGREQPISAAGVPRSECGASTHNKELQHWLAQAASVSL